LQDAIVPAVSLAEDGIACTVGYFHAADDPPDMVVATTLQVIEAVSGLNPKGYASIKAPAIQYESASLATLTDACRQHGLVAHFDSHEYETCDATLKCVREAVQRGCMAGVTLPGRWCRSVRDAEDMSALGVRVRVVKGEWSDPLEPVKDPRFGFLDVVDSLCGQTAEVAVATHDTWLAEEALSRLQNSGTACELELLYGLPMRALLRVAQRLSVPVRVYIPFGIAWRPYAASKVAENPRVLWWLMRDSVQGVHAKLIRLLSLQRDR
jgi:proline dehydrogenase